MKGVFWRLVEQIAREKMRSGFVIQRAFLRIMGMFLWERPSTFKRIYSVVYILVQIVSVATVNAFIINTKIKTTEDFTQIVNSLIVSVSFSAAVGKLLIMHWTCRNFKEMIEFLEDGFPPDGVVWHARNKFLMHTITVYWTVGGWLTYGILTRGWPWQAEFPWDKTTLHGHILGICLQAISSAPGGSTHLMIDSMVFAAVEKLKPHIRRLKRSLAGFGPDPAKNKELTREAVDLHNAILRSVTLINRAFSPIFMFQVIYLVPFICINAFVITQIGDVRYILTSVLPMSLAMALELYMFCSAGQVLASEMENMDHAYYDNNWYKAPLNSRKELSIMMECSRRDATLNAYGITYANNATLLAVLQQGYSYFLFLHTMVEALE